MTRIAFASLIVMTLLLTAVASCATPPPAPTPPPVAEGETPPPASPTPVVTAPTAEPEDGTLVVAYSGTVEQLDSNYAFGSRTAQTVIANVYDQVTVYDKVMSDDGYWVDDTDHIIGNVAESVEVSADHTTITYHLRDGVTFHDGSPLTAETVKFTFDRIIESQGVSYQYFDQGSVHSADAVEVVDENTLVLHLEQPNMLTLPLLTLENISPINPEAVRPHMSDDDPFAKEWMAINVAGSGPFMLESWTPGSEIVLSRFDDYWQGPAALEEVIIKIIPSVTDRILALESGDLDMIMDVPPRHLDSLQANPDVKVISAPSRTSLVLGMSMETPPLDNVLVRQAIAYAVPYDTILQEVYKGAARPNRNPVLCAGTPTYTEDFWTYDTDLDKAKDLLAQAGYPDGFETRIVIRAGIEEDEETAVWIKSNLEQIGITTHVEVLPLAAWNTQARAHALPMWISAVTFWVNDPFYSYFWDTRTGAPVNYAGYSNAEIDQLIQEYTPSTDAEARAEASRRVQEIAAEELPMLRLAATNVNVAMLKNVQGFHFGFDGYHVQRFYTMYKD